jgi:hypothetical protein
MRARLLLATLLAATLALGTGAAAPPPPAGDPFVIEYYYKVRWGHQEEFLTLFRKNHLPILEQEKAMGRILEIRAVAPRYHGTEESRWDYRVTIVFRDVAAAYSPGLSDAERRQLYPDQATFAKEEQRRFEILEAHWDVPVADLPLHP